MSTSSLQAKVNSIKEKRALYTQRVEDARKNNRPDIEKIWLDEIKVLDEAYAALSAQLKGKSQPETSTNHPPALEQRKLRQLDNQIQYIEKKIVIHKERGEITAVNKQTTLLNELKAEKAKLTSNTPLPSQASSAKQKTLDDLNAEIAHADKMIKEYKKFRSPKEQQWIGRRFQLIAQRDEIITGKKNRQSQTPPPLPTRPKPISSPKTPRSGTTHSASSSRNMITAAQAINNQVRVIDLEIAHANKMIKEYQRYKSPKADQWMQRKNELIHKRTRVTGQGHHTTSSEVSAQDPSVKKRLAVIQLELAHAGKMIREYQKYNSPKAHEWIEKRNNLLAEKGQLEGRNITTGHTSSPSPIPSNTNREAIKAQITSLNRKAKNADSNMRTALKRGDHQQANQLLQQRNQYNQQVKQLTAQLTGVAVSGSSPQRIPPATGGNVHTAKPSRPTPATPASSGNAGGHASDLEKSIAHKYLHTKRYTNEHAYIEIIDHLLSNPKYNHISPAKETLYDITHASKLPPSGMVINIPFIRDCFKIKVSGVRLEGYTINDTIFNTAFPSDFNQMVDRINPHLTPAPALKHYKYLAHRDAIQLIPADRNISKYHSQFAGAKIKDLVIKNITINSKGALQGLFASDGSFENIHMENIKVKTNSAHQIAILGLLSGTLDLSSSGGNPIHVNLLPLRLAGGNNIYINSFSRNSSYQYGRVNAGRSNAVIADNRQAMTKRGTYYKDFNMDDFFAAMRRADPNSHVLTRIKEAAKVAGTLAKIV